MVSHNFKLGKSQTDPVQKHGLTVLGIASNREPRMNKDDHPQFQTLLVKGKQIRMIEGA
jgi:hypothetical protein